MKNVEEVKQELMEIIGICERLVEMGKYFRKDFRFFKEQAQRLLDSNKDPMDFKVDAAGFRRKLEHHLNEAYDRTFSDRRILIGKIAGVSGDNKISKELTDLEYRITDFMRGSEYVLENNDKYEKFLNMVDAKIEEARRMHEELG